MDNTARAPERAARTAPTIEVPSGWPEVQAELAAGAGLSLLLIEGRQPPSLAISNNNSICHAFQSSPTHAHLCEPYCGEAYQRALKAGGPESYRCHAGLHCVCLPVDLGAEKQLAVIGGRAFLRSGDYRALAERIRVGDLTDLLSAELFRNVIFALRQDLDDLADSVSEAAREFLKTPATSDESSASKEKGRSHGKEVAADSPEKAGKVVGQTIIEVTQSIKTLLRDTTLKEVCNKSVASLIEQHGLRSLALLLRTDDSFQPMWVTGVFQDAPPRVVLKAKEFKLLQAATHGQSITVPASGRASTKHEETVELFPLFVGEEIKGALLVGDRNLTETQREAVASLCRDIALPLEVLRLREELERRMRAATHLQAFSEIVNTAQPDEAYASILRHSADLLRAERGSLLLFDERANELEIKALVGPRGAEVARDARIPIGDSVAWVTLREGRPFVVRDVDTATGMRRAPAERSYKTNSFISYPILIGGRKVGVLNVTDKAGGGVYDEFDLGLLDMIAPQMALALDRAEWHQKATQFQLLSITDPLTGLVNRRYLEERLSEELDRSKRHHFAMSFMMMDIDDFKAYNDRHGHQAGDHALEMTAECLKTALRSVDTAARYGGEEFSILLPQTSMSEARVIAERIRRRVERTRFPHAKSQPHGAVTVSIGISSFGPELDTPASVIYAADQALYAAKNHGKNCVESFESKSLKGETGDAPKAEKNAR